MPVLWQPEFLPTAVLIAAAPGNFTRTLRLDDLGLAAAQVDRICQDDRYLILHDGHRLWFPGSAPDGSLAALIPLDDDFLLRIGGLLRFHQYLTGHKVSPIPRSMQLTRRHRNRLILMLRALDARLESATYRDIAAALLDPSVTHLSATEWKNSASRAQAIRLVADGIATMNGGYLKLLRGR